MLDSWKREIMQFQQTEFAMVARLRPAGNHFAPRISDLKESNAGPGRRQACADESSPFSWPLCARS
jgi:hypothetical protein